MDKETNEKTNWSAWIDRVNRIVSFQAAEGFEEMVFPTHEEMFSFVIKMSESGHRIQ